MHSTKIAATVAALTLTAIPAVLAQSGGAAPSRYLLPPTAVIDIVDAPALPFVEVSPARDVLAVLPRRGMLSIEEVSKPMLRLAGLRINPANNGLHRAPAGTGVVLRAIATGSERPIHVPPAARIGDFKFSPDGKRFSFTNTRESRIDLHVGDVATGQTRLVDGAINGVAGSCEWLDDSSALLCPFVPDARGAPPTPPTLPAGPNIQENYGKPGPVRTYQDLLTSAHDENLFEYYFTSQLSFVDAATGKRTPIGKSGMVGGKTSPDGQYILVERVKRPFSRLLPFDEFPHDVEVWNRQGQIVRAIADVPMGDTVPIRGVITGPRGYRWTPLEPSTLVWAEALDKGDIRNAVPHRDRIVSLKAPFKDDPTDVAKTQFRFGGVNWTDKGTILLTENDRATRTTRTWLLKPDWSEPRKLWDRKQQDSYGNPGQPVLRGGADTILQHGDSIFLTGQGASPQGDRPFLDRLNLATLGTDRVFRSDDTSLESVVALLDDSGSRFLTRYESRTEAPNYFVRQAGETARRSVTTFKDPHPQITPATANRMFVTYTRKDGVGLSGTIYLPVGYQKGQRVPMVVWAYPREFVDADAAGQVVGSPNRFTPVGGSSHLLLLTQGYAIFDGPTMPIVGPGETANDTYVEQLVSSAEAAVEKAVALGIADRARIGVGGHSYGAFMTANLLAHSDLFAAGIARSGAYNRSLTPFGFQAETRTFWEIPDIYAKMSPFWNAHKINEPILLIHGEADDNSGTFPIQSERLYMALKGHGATVRYVTLPNEAHGYAARESNLHVLAETITWLDKYVKNAPAKRLTDSASR
jgi:dipeptidyl aminopeptidase/acylaminoacyl peptidase